MMTIEPIMVSYFEHAIQSPLTQVCLVFVFGTTPNHIRLKYRCQNKISNYIRHVLPYVVI